MQRKTERKRPCSAEEEENQSDTLSLLVAVGLCRGKELSVRGGELRLDLDCWGLYRGWWLAVRRIGKQTSCR